MNENTFLAALERHLHLQGTPFELGELVEFVDEVWPTARKTADDIDRWAAEFHPPVAIEVTR